MTKIIFAYFAIAILSIAFLQVYNKDGSLIDFENVPYTLEQIPNPQEYDALEATLLYLLQGLETWASWLDPTNDIGLLPEAEGRFMTSSTPILQTGMSPNGIGIVGFAQHIVISDNGMPNGFNQSEFYETSLFNYDDQVEDVFEKVPYLDRLNYQYGVEIDGRRARIYRKPIETEFTLNAMLQKMGIPPEIAEIWVEEYAEIASLPQTIQLSWLIAGNPLAEDYQLHIENVLETLDLNALLAQGAANQSFSLSSNVQWVNQDPFWAEVQKQPLLNAFVNLLSDASEEIQRSFIVSLFFLEPIPYGIGAVGRSNNDQTNNSEGAKIRSKPFFWSDSTKNTSTNNNSLAFTAGSIIDPDQSLVAEAMKQGANLIKYWTPEQGYQIIPWSQVIQLDPNKQGANYFIMAVTALTQFGPRANKKHYRTNYEVIVGSIINNRLPKNQPVFKVFLGPKESDRKIIDAEGIVVGLSGSTFLWSAEKLDNDTILQVASEHHSSRNTPYVVAHIDDGPYMAGSLSQIKRFFAGRLGYVVEAAVLKAKGIHTGAHSTHTYTADRTRAHWLSSAGNIALDIFNWSPQDRVLVQSASRRVQFERGSSSSSKIKASSMVIWESLPANQELLEYREPWSVNLFLVQTPKGYFSIPTSELEYLLENADEEVQVHTLLLSQAASLHLENLYVARRALSNRNLNCESVRVLAGEGLELAYSPECSLLITKSGWELAQANEQKQLEIARKINQPILIFHTEGKPASAIYLKALSDAEQRSINNLRVSTVVPIYRLEGLDAEEIENDITISVADVLQRTLRFFPEQREFEVLMPEGKHIKYTSTSPKGFRAKHDYDTINLTEPIKGHPITFYSLGER